MKITDVQLTLVTGAMKEKIYNASRSYDRRFFVIIKLVTDEGIEGYGYVEGVNDVDRIAYEILCTYKNLIIGEDAFAREKIYHKLSRHTTRYGRRGMVIRCISGIDFALWDIAGKAANLPIYKLIGFCKDNIKTYASGGYYAMDGSNDMEALRDEAARYKEMGYKAMKIKIGRMEDVRDDIDRTAQIRGIIGDDIGLMVDVNEGWTLSKAIQYCEGIKDLNIFWIEEPFKPDDFASLRELTKRTNIPIACGENEYTRYGFQELISTGIMFANVDAGRCGGISEWLKIAAICDVNGVEVVPHCSQEIHATCVACSTNAPMMEYFMPDHPLQEFASELFPEGCALRKGNGVVAPLDVPGLGIDPDPDAVNKYKVNL